MSQSRAEVVSRVVNRDEKTGITELSIQVPDVPALGYKVVEIGTAPAQMVAAPRRAAQEGGKFISLKMQR